MCPLQKSDKANYEMIYAINTLSKCGAFYINDEIIVFGLIRHDILKCSFFLFSFCDLDWLQSRLEFWR